MTGPAPAAPLPSAQAAGEREWGARSISVRYGAATALSGVSLAARAGQVTAVVGGDGAGKTTLLRCLAGALAPAAGEVRTPGRRRTGYLPESSGTYPDLTVAENLAFRAAAYGMPSALARTRAADLTTQAGLAAARDRLAGQLSGGMRQKFGVICALLHEPDLLVLDEPTTGVDPVSRAGLWQLIAGAAAAGAAVVLSTTYLTEAERAATVLVLEGGRPLAAGTPEEIVAALPGTIVALTGPPGEAARPRSWCRGGQWRTWDPPGAPPAPGQRIEPDLQDAVTVAALGTEPGVLAGEPAVRAGEPGVPSGAAPAQTPEPAAKARASAGPRSLPPSRTAQARTGALAECIGVTRKFGAATAVRDVSLAVGPGEIVGLLGANGAGKTTLIRMLLGLLAATSGTIALFGAPPSRDSRRRIGYVPQGLGLYADLTVAENRSFAAAVFGVPPGELPEGLQSRAAVPVGELPLGLQRRAAFAQALAHRPGLLILDEPTSGVEPLSRARLWETIRAAADEGAGVLVTTHYLEEAYECDQLVVLAGGGVVAGGTPAEVIGAATVTVVEAPAWRPAFGRLEERGLAVTLTGQSLRLPSADPDQVRQALAGEPGPAARIYTAPATLEERFFQLVQS